MDPARRRFFRSLGGNRQEIRRPPWTGDDFTDACTRCEACIEICPEQVLFKGDGGFPEINFRDEGCSLCKRCVEVCEAPVFDLERPAFPWKAQVQSQCLAQAGIHCQTCQDACEWQAIRFRPRLGGPPWPEIDADACTGCGACEALCPNNAITMSDNNDNKVSP